VGFGQATLCLRRGHQSRNPHGILYVVYTHMAFVNLGFRVDRLCSSGWSLYDQILAQVAYLWDGLHLDHYPVVSRFEPATADLPTVRLRRCAGWPYPLAVARSTESSSKGFALVHLWTGPWKSDSHDCSTCGSEWEGRLGSESTGILTPYIHFDPGSLDVYAPRTGRFGLGRSQISPPKNNGFSQPRLKYCR